MNPLKSIKNNIPNAITCMNLLAGSLACVCASHGSQPTGYGSMAYYQLAFIMIAAAAVFDFFDGFVARLLNAVSPIGKELDSLSDCVSFGLAPALIVFFMTRELYPESWIAFCALLIAIFGAVRLARFNTDDTQATSFVGLPIPANAIFWIGFCNHFYTQPSTTANEYIILAAIIVLSYAMVSRLRMFSLKFKAGQKDSIVYKLRVGFIGFCVAVSIGIFLFGLQFSMIFIVAVTGYVIMNLANWLSQRK